MIELVSPLPAPHDRRYAWRPGDRLTHVDGRAVADILDLYYYQSERGRMLLRIRRRDGGALDLTLPPAALAALTACFAPLEFRRCACRCVFCFVDQNPRGMRPAIYLKDEDYRFSFLYGNYTTLTSLGRRGLRRIIEQRLSPLFVSVHCTDPEVRARMLGTANRWDVCAVLRELAGHGIELHTQIVLCPGWNDGGNLERSFHDLFALRRAAEDAGGIASLAVVPVGLTAHREGLTPLVPVTGAIAAAVIDQVAPWQAAAAAAWEGPFLHLSDEFYLLADRELPPAAHYAGFPQEDNGAGLTRRLEAAWLASLADASAGRRLPQRPLTILTAEMAARALSRYLVPALVAAGAPRPEIVAVRNEFYGHSVTVAGLLAGADLRRGLLSLPAEPPRTVCLSPRAFNADGLTLDDMTLAQIAANQPHEVLVAEEEGFVEWWAGIPAADAAAR